MRAGGNAAWLGAIPAGESDAEFLAALTVQHGAVEQQAGRWYSVNSIGMATLCRCELDARREAERSDAMYPRHRPHRAVRLVEVVQASARKPAGESDAEFQVALAVQQGEDIDAAFEAKVGTWQESSDPDGHDRARGWFGRGWRAALAAQEATAPGAQDGKCPTCGSYRNEIDELIKAEREIERLRAARAAQAAAVCDWRLVDDEAGIWSASCDAGLAYTFVDGGPAENGHRHCHGCGRVLVVEGRA